MFKKNSFILLLLVIAHWGFGQVTYDSGYVMNQSGKKQSCLIKNVEWENTPSFFSYKLTDKGEILQGTPLNTSGFRIANSWKYVSRKVTFDTAYNKDDVANLPTEATATRATRTIFLKVLLEGKASLYEYRTQAYTRFFFSSESTPMTELVFRNYVTEDMAINQNTSFRQQLFSKLTCGEITEKDFKQLEYSDKALLALFEKYNICSKATFVNYSKMNVSKRLFHLNIRPGVNFSSFDITSVYEGLTYKFGSKTTPRIGLEAEMTLPFNRNKWAIIVEPGLEFYSSTFDEQSFAKFTLLRIPAGVRHYFFLPNKTSLFVNGLVAVSPVFNTSIGVPPEVKLETALRPSFLVGCGYKFSSRAAVELRYCLPSSTLENYTGYVAEYRSLSVIASWQLGK